MVSFEVIGENEEEQLRSVERLLDAEEIERAAATVTRPTARMHLEALAKKLRKESEALKRVEASVVQAEEPATKEEKKIDSEKAPSAKPATNAAAVPPPKPIASAPALSPSVKYVPIDRFAFDAGGYNAPFVTLYVDLPRVGSIARANITCDFTKSSFDLVVRDLEGKSYRLYKDNLEKDINPDNSKIVVKADKIIVKLGKIKSEYGSYDYWSDLIDKKKRKTAVDGSRDKDDPQKSIMELMKNMYEEGDDNIRKVIGETMMKQQRGELNRDFDKGLDDF